jgi:hypothetical protein
MVVETSTCINAFLDGAAAPPPPPLLLTAQTNIFYAIPPPKTVLAQESIHKPPSNPRRTPRHTSRRSNSLYVRPPKLTVRIAMPSHNDNDNGSDGGDSSDGSNGSKDTEDAPRRISKPPGEPGCLKQGGYNLDTALGMSPNEIAKLKVRRRSSYLQCFVATNARCRAQCTIL